ncbi:MAG: hypothetical protein ACFBWO_00905 [Paracoccaceae bacterium]
MKRVPVDEIAERLERRDHRGPRLSIEASRAWFTGCTHFGHQGALGHRRRRHFEDVEAHDAALFDALAERVGADDVLFHLGDVSWRERDTDVARLPGRWRVLVRGNHDHGRVVRSAHWDLVVDYLDLELLRPEGRARAILSHYPMASWDGARRAVHLHSHTHAKLGPLATEYGGRVDVGMDAQNLAPVGFDAVLAQIEAHRAEHGFLVPGDY